MAPPVLLILKITGSQCGPKVSVVTHMLCMQVDQKMLWKDYNCLLEGHGLGRESPRWLLGAISDAEMNTAQTGSPLGRASNLKNKKFLASLKFIQTKRLGVFTVIHWECLKHAS